MPNNEDVSAVRANLDQIMERFGRLYNVSRELLDHEGTTDLPDWDDLPENLHTVWVTALNSYMVPFLLGSALADMRTVLDHLKAQTN